MPEEDDPQVTDLVPVMRLHLHAGLMALDRAIKKSAAEDIAASVREGHTTTRPSHFTRELGQAYDSLILYIGVKEDEDEPVLLPGVPLSPTGEAEPTG